MSLADDGYEFLPSIDAQSCLALDRRLREQRDFDRSLFMTEAEFDDEPIYKGVNPRPGRNLLANVSLAGIVGPIHSFLTEWLGEYTTLDAKLVCGLPESELPQWVKRKTEGREVNNLGPYIRPEYRDVTYFHGIAYHQDLIDYPNREPNFLTVYVYLHEVGPFDAPLIILEGSHKAGAQTFPHPSKFTSQFLWRSMQGPAGTIAAWHPCTLHGTVGASNSARLSIRCLFTGEGGKLKELNRQINATSLAQTRHDLALDGSAR